LRSHAQKLLSHLAALRASRIICVSQQLAGRLWWCRRKVAVVPSGVDLDLFFPIDRSAARDRLGWGRDERVVLFAAGASPAVKRLDLAEASMTHARELAGAVRFVVLRGDVPHQEMPFYLSGADCLLFTSDYEGSPDIIKESLVCNLPVVSVDVGDVPERLGGVHPSTVVAREPRALGTAVARVVSCAQRSNGRERTREISAEVVRDRIMLIYRQVVTKNGRVGCIAKV